MHETIFFHRNAHLFRLHTQLKGNRWHTMIINFNVTVVINYFDGWLCFFRSSLCLVKNMLWLKHWWKKTAHYPNQKAPLPNLGNLPPRLGTSDIAVLYLRRFLVRCWHSRRCSRGHASFNAALCKHCDSWLTTREPVAVSGFIDVRCHRRWLTADSVTVSAAAA